MVAIQIILDDRIGARRSLAARASYLFMTRRLQNISIRRRADAQTLRDSAGIHETVT